MKLFGKALIATALTVALASPASALILDKSASASQGTLVHNPGPETLGYDVVATLGSQGPQIVHFTGDTTQTSSLSDLLLLKKGQGQSDITGAEIAGGKGTYPFYSASIFLTDFQGMSWLEFALTGTGKGGTVDFLVYDQLGIAHLFSDMPMGSGDTHFAFQATGMDYITKLTFIADAPPGTIDFIKQVRIDLSTAPRVPEPATWAMMIVGFGAAGVAMRRRRRNLVSQLA